MNCLHQHLDVLDHDRREEQERTSFFYQVPIQTDEAADSTPACLPFCSQSLVSHPGINNVVKCMRVCVTSFIYSHLKESPL